MRYPGWVSTSVFTIRSLLLVVHWRATHQTESKLSDAEVSCETLPHCLTRWPKTRSPCSKFLSLDLHAFFFFFSLRGALHSCFCCAILLPAQFAAVATHRQVCRTKFSRFRARWTYTVWAWTNWRLMGLHGSWWWDMYRLCTGRICLQIITAEQQQQQLGVWKFGGGGTVQMALTHSGGLARKWVLYRKKLQVEKKIFKYYNALAAEY